MRNRHDFEKMKQREQEHMEHMEQMEQMEQNIQTAIQLCELHAKSIKQGIRVVSKGVLAFYVLCVIAQAASFNVMALTQIVFSLIYLDYRGDQERTMPTITSKIKDVVCGEKSPPEKVEYHVKNIFSGLRITATKDLNKVADYVLQC